MESGLPEEDSEIAAEGTLLHSFDANPKLDRNSLKQTQRDLLDISKKLTAAAYSTITDQFGITESDNVLAGVEREMFLHRGIRSLFSGHCDEWRYVPRVKLLIVLERKYGFIAVDPANSNLQTRTYAAMGSELHDCDNVAVGIISPRVPREDRLTLAVYTRDEIAAAKEQLFEIWDACNSEDAPLNPTQSGCRYCLAKLICPAYREAFQAPLALVPHPNGVGTVAKRQADAERSLAQLTDNDLGRVLDAIQFADFLKDRARDVARERIQAGGMTGWKLGKEKEKRNVTDVYQAAQILKGEGLPIEKIMGTCSMSLGDDGGVAEIYREQKKLTWKEAKDDINRLLCAVIEKSPMKPSISRDQKLLKSQ